MFENEIIDPLSEVVKNLFGLSYLFPYQRLVVANILEAAEAAGLQIKWTKQEESTYVASTDAETEPLAGDDRLDEAEIPAVDNELFDRGNSGRQIVILPTGAGKSLCFQLPAMLIEGLTLVVYPILSLMADQERRLSERGFSPVIIRGGQTKEEREQIWTKLESGESRFIIANTEVLLTPQVKEKLEKIKVVHVVIDEAHCVSEWGESFRPSYLEIGNIINAINPPLVTAFTATASSTVLEKITQYIFADNDTPQIVGNPDRPNIFYSAKGCINRDLAVRDLLLANSRPAIVFCSSRPGTEELSHYLRNEFAEKGLPWHGEIRFYHAGLSREEKAQTEKWFFGNSEGVLCATCAYGMGVDKADVRTVIHRDCAPSVEAYLQESGRAGRDGGQSKAYLLFGPEDNIALTRAPNDINRKRVSALLQYARDIKNCRRHALLAMLDFNSNGEVPENLCCDVCENQADNSLREEASIMNFFRKNKRRYTSFEATEVLAGISKGTGMSFSHEEAGQVISYLLKIGKLKKTRKFPWKNKLTI
ncbi:MAG: RecQ family ATP-dependent DNA helicase [Treponema sp.]|nr:RecQ family ATP-dependent DNA helicase [Treponema sp.]